MSTAVAEIAEQGGSLSGIRLRGGPALAVAAAVVALGIRFFLIISKNSVNVFFYDQWEYLTPFFRQPPGFTELFFLQHGPHREGIGLFADKFLYPLTHWNARVDSFIVGGSIFAAMLLALWLKYKLFGRLAYSDISIPLIFLTLQQSEIVVGAANPGTAGLPLLMIMLYCLALLGRNRLLKYAILLALNFLLIYTGYGLFMGVVTVGVFLLECDWSWRGITSASFASACAALVLAAASLASYFVHYTFSSGVDCFEIPHDRWLQYPRFSALMFSGFVVPRPLHVSWEMTALGTALLVISVAVLGWYLCHVMHNASCPGALVGAVLLSYSLMFCATAPIGRLCLGLQAALESRYVTLMIPAFLAIYFYLLSKAGGGRRNVVFSLWVLLLMPATVLKPWEEVRWYSDGKRDWAKCYVRTENIEFCDRTTNFFLHTPVGETGLREKLDYLKQHHLNLFSGVKPQ